MHLTVDLFLQYGYWILFGWVLIEQLGAPIPSSPILVIAGTLTAAHDMSLGGILMAVMGGSMVADSVWFRLGGRYGSSVTHWLCKYSLETNSCVRKTEEMLGRSGPYTLLVAKFIPGLNTMAAPLAGQSRMKYRTFLLYDAAGIFLWVTALVLVGRFFGRAVQHNEALLHWLGSSAFALVILAVFGMLMYRVVRRWSFERKLQAMRIGPDELKDMMDRGEDVYLIDLRHPLDILPDPRTLPGAIRLLPSELVARNAEIPRDRDIVLYCTCPSEATSAKVALTMRRLGIERVRPLRGGFKGWKDQGYPLVEVAVPHSRQISQAPCEA